MKMMFMMRERLCCSHVFSWDLRWMVRHAASHVHVRFCSLFNFNWVATTLLVALMDFSKINIEINNLARSWSWHSCSGLYRSLNEWFDISLNANIICLTKSLMIYRNSSSLFNLYSKHCVQMTNRNFSLWIRLILDWVKWVFESSAWHSFKKKRKMNNFIKGHKHHPM